MNAIANAVKGMAGALQCVAGYWGDYSRVGGGSERVKALLVQRDYEVVDDQGIVTVVKSHDWLFRAEQLNTLMPPQLGDTWMVRENGLDNSQVDDFSFPYEAMEIGTRPCFEPHDAQGVMVVVHMKRVPNA